MAGPIAAPEGPAAPPPWHGGRYIAAGASLWALGLWLTGGDQMYIILTITALIFGPGLARGVREGEYSAYSVFNPGGRHLLGDLRAEQLDREQRGDQYLAGAARDDGGLVDLPQGGLLAGGGSDEEDDDAPLVRSREANKPCQCGSGKKAKRCCFAARPRAASARQPGQKPASPEPDPLLDRWRAEMEVVRTGAGQERKAR
ncbi:unnamed protein product [Prorocentrum cordatum]|uniref:SAYSvFN domain-containing protein n=1 Tax=Prorocentrum cordatum TaxID=2364126 RepID=A0ABN9QRC7_9DINO|nr:unnamed protein product [Polarella glacialis]